MTPKIVSIPAKKLIGYSIEMSLLDNQTQTIWQLFMPRLKEIKNAVSADLFSLQNYPEDYFTNFTPETIFTKWAAVEVKNFENIPEGFEKLEIPSGKYAVFLHKGNTEMFAKTAQYIYTEWLPNSGFQLDNKPHFEVLGDNYLGHENPESEEEIWIPII
ncbi:MAG: AraC family transcriptional regulator [Flavobacteria bacterium RIFCSPLOWO2_12_FULL_31_7]|nr:MAG: AraC family transcriptional regulator [Flavobacteria bacterium RIFCSPLOWO2_12_FULL_31_7]